MVSHQMNIVNISLDFSSNLMIFGVFFTWCKIISWGMRYKEKCLKSFIWMTQKRNQNITFSFLGLENLKTHILIGSLWRWNSPFLTIRHSATESSFSPLTRKICCNLISRGQIETLRCVPSPSAGRNPSCAELIGNKLAEITDPASISRQGLNLLQPAASPPSLGTVGLRRGTKRIRHLGRARLPLPVF